MGTLLMLFSALFSILKVVVLILLAIALYKYIKKN